MASIEEVDYNWDDDIKQWQEELNEINTRLEEKLKEIDEL
jgi:hypothetical protein